MTVPRDISVVGIDDIHLGSLFAPALTTVHQPVDALGEAAVDPLSRRLGDEDDGQTNHIILKPNLVRRASAGLPGGFLG
jgi:LacI family transcriptional regulator